MPKPRKPVPPEKTVFISYRREPSKHLSLLIFKDLYARGYDVFRDNESIGAGEFEKVILGGIAAHAHFLVILWGETLHRCSEPRDWLRREIEHAIDLGRNIVPIAVDEFDLKEAEKYLPGKLAKLLNYNALRLHSDYFDDGMKRLRQNYLKKSVYPQVIPTPAAIRITVENTITEDINLPNPTPKELNAEEFLNRGISKMRDLNFNGAIADYNKALKLNPNYPPAYNNRGNAQSRKENLDEAIADYDKALNLDPQFVYAYSNRAGAKSRKGDFEGAIADCNKALELDPQFAHAYNNRGATRALKKDYDGAIADCTKAIEINPQFADAYNNRGMARYHKKDFEGAIADCTKAIELDPQSIETYNNRASARYGKGDYEGILEDCQLALRIKPNVAGYNNCGVAYFALEDYVQALASYKEALGLDPNFKFSLGGIAITYHVLGDVVKARRYWRKLLKLNYRYRDPEWVREELNWADPLVDEAKKLIARL